MLKINYNLFAAYLAFFFFVLYGAFTDNKLHFLIGSIFGLIPFNEFLKKELYNWPKSLTIFFCVLLFSYPISIINNSLSGGYFTLPMVLSSIGIAYLFKINDNSIKIVRSFLILLLIIFFTSIFILDLSANEIFIGSRNKVSIILLGLSIFLIVLDPSNNRNLFLVFLVFLANVLAIGSSGIITGLILLIICYIYYYNSLSKFTRLITIVSLLLILLIFFTGFIVFFEELETIFTISDYRSQSLQSRIFGGDVRYQLWSQYFNKYFVGTTLFFGTPFDFNFMVILNDSYVLFKTVHSSYIMLHSKTGIFSVFLLIAIIVRLNYLRRKNLFFACLLLVILIRSYSDTAFILDGTFNYAFYIFFLPNFILFNK